MVMKTQVFWDATLCQLMKLLAFYSSLEDCNLQHPCKNLKSCIYSAVMLQ